MELELENNNKKKGDGEGSEGKQKEKKQEEEKPEAERRNEKDGPQEQYRVVVNRSSSESLERMLEQVTNGFEAGEVTKSDLTNWLIAKAVEGFGDFEVRTIRHLHFNEKKILASILKNSKTENDLPAELKKAIREHYGLSEPNKKFSSLKIKNAA